MREPLKEDIKTIEEDKPLPDLIIVDGGKGQLSSAYSILEKLGIEKKVPIIGLAKRLEEVFSRARANPSNFQERQAVLN